jgi:ankyrin repeat protein
MNSLKKTLFIVLAFASHSTSAQTIDYNAVATHQLWHAIVDNDLIAAQKAIEEGANPNGTPGKVFILLAAKLNHEAMVTFLIFHKADVNAQCPSSGETALIIACRYGRPALVKILLDAQANYTIEDKERKTAQEWAKDMASLYKVTKEALPYLRCSNLISQKISADQIMHDYHLGKISRPR